ncbi:hypothetical protein HanRHA438_Chr02g0050091 [Helianthus annuus]|nr:hypothetical protein HanIR_Chr02g0054661 [Helianthus annuus]KAJ0617529.1 hypothetical protein HanHA89_Chr02g0042851 [Helianthus annuus]KAJ0776069.1 hypothetical protein HanLR1_Chr02g0041411 [Helianthus annuus]KAJ0938461.1 hypothetical protein HanRHA438_Chr02g0050091 [Helianthus annuus]
MSLLDALKVPNMDVLDFDFEEQPEGEASLMKQIAASAHPIRTTADPNAATSSAAEATSFVPENPSEQAADKIASLAPTSSKGADGSSGSQAGENPFWTMWIVIRKSAIWTTLFCIGLHP